jgi:2-polyprenyl-3-methyl-5-hydroxy-6-metoxy-1,4-benzoquinol methylase
VNFLDIGCGEGALSQRFSDNGATVLSVDTDAVNFNAKTKFEQINFDNPGEVNAFAKKHNQYFDIVGAVEVIEHLKNPWELLTTMRLMVKENGCAIITTPNIGSMISRINLLRSGTILHFEEKDLKYGHITPISMTKMEHIASATGWKIQAWAPGGSLPKIWLGWQSNLWLYTFLSLLFRPVCKGPKNGWCLLYFLIPC